MPLNGVCMGGGTQKGGPLLSSTKKKRCVRAISPIFSFRGKPDMDACRLAFVEAVVAVLV